MKRGSFHLGAERMPARIEALPLHESLEPPWPPRLEPCFMEPPGNQSPGVEQVDKLVEKVDEQGLAVLRLEPHSDAQRGLGASAGKGLREDVAEGFRGGLEEARQIGRLQPDRDIRRVIQVLEGHVRAPRPVQRQASCHFVPRVVEFHPDMIPPRLKRAPIPEGPYDLVIEGGGILGSAIARDAALRGKNVVLLERGDFGGATSGRTSKLIHGGIRYLEQLRLGLVAESLRERALLLRLAPHLVRPLRFLLPVREGARLGVKKVRVGLFLYDLLALGRRVAPSGFQDARLAGESLPGIRTEGLLGCGFYHDAVMDDARLVLANVLAAIDAGASQGRMVVVRNHAEVKAMRPGSPGRLVYRDRVTGTESAVLAHQIVRAIGPWTDPELLVPSKGAHLLLPHLPLRDAVLLTHSEDGRVFFLIPWIAGTLVGTTEEPFEGDPAGVRVEPADVDYLLAEVNRVFPTLNARKSDIRGVFAGVRPLARRRSLPFGPAARRGRGGVSRTHRIHVDRHGVLSVYGGKYTNHRSVARRVVDRVFPGTHSRTHVQPLPGGEDGAWESAREALRNEAERLGAEEVERLFHRYGSRLREVLALVENDPGLGERIGPDCRELKAEVVHAVCRELAVYPADFLARRTTLRWSVDGGRSVYDAVEQLFREHSTATPADLDAARTDYFSEMEAQDSLRRD